MDQEMDRICKDQAKLRALKNVLKEMPGVMIDCSSGREMYNFVMSCIDGDEE